MARQDGVLKLKGELGGISFYKTGLDGYLARQKGGVDAQRIKNDPAFARTRENGAEFGRAGIASKLLRTAFRSLILNAADSRMNSRLTQKLVEVIKKDAAGARGERTVTGTALNVLANFEFNLDGKLNSTLFAPFTTNVNRETGTITIDLPAFISEEMIAAPTGATHFKLVAAAAGLDFAEVGYTLDTDASPDIALDSEVPATATLELTLPPAGTDPLFVTFGIEFAQIVNGTMYALNNGAYNALAIVAIDPGA